MDMITALATGDVTQIGITVLKASIIGCLAGILAGNKGEGILSNALYGVVGSLLGSWLFPVLGISIGGWYGYYIEAIIGAVIAILLSRAVFAVAMAAGIILLLIYWPF